MTSAFGTNTLLLSGRFDGISDSINWTVSRSSGASGQEHDALRRVLVDCR